MFFYQSGIVNPAEQRSDILRRCLFLRRAYLFAWGCVSWQGWPLGSLETDRRAVRSWAGWEWAGLVGREQQQVARPTIDSGNSQAHGLNHVLALWGLILLWRKKEPSDDEVEKEFASRTATQDLPSYLTLENDWLEPALGEMQTFEISRETTRFTLNFPCILNVSILNLVSSILQSAHQRYENLV